MFQDVEYKALNTLQPCVSYELPFVSSTVQLEIKLHVVNLMLCWFCTLLACFARS
jgi:hypothetical protein